LIRIIRASDVWRGLAALGLLSAGRRGPGEAAYGGDVGFRDSVAQTRTTPLPHVEYSRIARRQREGLMSHSKQAEIPSDHFAPQEALEVARYVTVMTVQLEAMAVAARLDLLAYFLGMARAQCDLVVRGNAQADGSKVESEEIGPVDSD
jgi:hypothetical protein